MVSFIVLELSISNVFTSDSPFSNLSLYFLHPDSQEHIPLLFLLAHLLLFTLLHPPPLPALLTGLSVQIPHPPVLQAPHLLRSQQDWAFHWNFCYPDWCFSLRPANLLQWWLGFSPWLGRADSPAGDGQGQVLAGAQGGGWRCLWCCCWQRTKHGGSSTVHF